MGNRRNKPANKWVGYEKASAEIRKWFLEKVLPKSKDSKPVPNYTYGDGWNNCLAEIRRRLEANEK